MARPAADLRERRVPRREQLTVLRRGAAVAIAALLLASPAAPAQQALVLSGGGARGLAHAGAVLGLEQRGYDPAIVTGTSMGAIIGALYAAGYSAESIVALIEAEDWRELFAPVPQPLGPDREWRRPMVSLGNGQAPFNLEGLLEAPRIDRTLIRLLFDAGVRAGNDFDSLPRRFRAIAADLADGSELPIGAGDLPRAVRASMAVPGVFAPIPWDGRVLVDGGIANNMPVSVARELGAATVVAVDVLRPRAPPAGNPLDIAVRSLRWTLANALPPAEPPEVIVLPPLAPGFNEVAFPRDASPLIRTGLRAALEAPIATDPPDGARPALPPPDSIHEVVIESPDPRLAPLARAAFGGLAPSHYRPDAILAATDRLLTAFPVRAVWPRVERVGGRNRLVVLVIPETDFEVAAAAVWERDRGGRAWAQAAHRLPGSWTPVAALAGSAGALDRGADLSLRLHPPALLPFAISAGAHFRRTGVRVFDGDTIASELHVDRWGGWLGAEWQRLAPDAGAVLAFRAERIEIAHAGTGWSLGPLLRMGLTGPASRVVGAPAGLEAEFRTGDVAYRRARATASVPLGGGRLRAALLADVAATWGDAPPDALPDLGGLDGLPGLREQRFRDRARAIAGVDLAWPIPFSGDVRLRLRTGAAAGAIDSLDDARWIGAAGLGLVWWTVAGSLDIEVGATTRGHERLEIAVGQRF